MARRSQSTKINGATFRVGLSSLFFHFGLTRSTSQNDHVMLTLLRTLYSFLPLGNRMYLLPPRSCVVKKLLSPVLPWACTNSETFFPLGYASSSFCQGQRRWQFSAQGISDSYQMRSRHKPDKPSNIAHNRNIHLSRCWSFWWAWTFSPELPEFLTYAHLLYRTVHADVVLEVEGKSHLGHYEVLHWYRKPRSVYLLCRSKVLRHHIRWANPLHSRLYFYAWNHSYFWGMVFYHSSYGPPIQIVFSENFRKYLKSLFRPFKGM